MIVKFENASSRAPDGHTRSSSGLVTCRISIATYQEMPTYSLHRKCGAVNVRLF